MTPLLEVNGICKSFGGFSLQNISFSLEPGFILGIIGANGSGKTTLLRTLLHLYRPDAGTVTVDGSSAADNEPFVRQRIGAVLEQDFFEDRWSAAKNAACFGKFYPDFRFSVFQESCRRFEISPDQKVKSLSIGARRKLQFAFALACRPSLYLMDEPADGLDPGFRRSLLSCMQEIVESGQRSVVFSTHLISDLDRIADYILMLKDGRMQFFLDRESLCSRFCLLRGTREELNALPEAWIMGQKHREYHSEALILITEENRRHFQRVPHPDLSTVFYYLERGNVSC